MEQLLPLLDLSSTLTLSSTHSLALEVLQQKRIWKNLILRVKLAKPRFWHCGNSIEIKEMQTRVDLLTSLLKLMEEPGPLLKILLETICLNFPPAVDENGHEDVIFINSPMVFNTGFFVSPTGFLLLERVESRMNSKVQVVSEVHLHYLWDSLGTALAARTSRQEGLVSKLQCEAIEFTEEELAGESINFLQRCKSWKVESLCLYELGHSGWRELAKALAGGRGELGSVQTSREVVVEGRKEDVRQVWAATRSDLLQLFSAFSFTLLDLSCIYAGSTGLLVEQQI